MNVSNGLFEITFNRKEILQPLKKFECRINKNVQLLKWEIWRHTFYGIVSVLFHVSLTYQHKSTNTSMTTVDDSRWISGRWIKRTKCTNIYFYQRVKFTCIKNSRILHLKYCLLFDSMTWCQQPGYLWRTIRKAIIGVECVFYNGSTDLRASLSNSRWRNTNTKGFDADHSSMFVNRMWACNDGWAAVW